MTPVWLFELFRCDDRRPAQRLVATLMQQDKPIQEKFAQRVFAGLRSPDEDIRWKAAMVVKELVLWYPKLAPSEILEEMSRDKSFSVRSSAAVCYYYIAAIDPASVPLDILGKLASTEEDWYVHTPATSALLRLGRARPVVIDILARELNQEDDYAHEHAATSIRRLSQRDSDLLTEELIKRMLGNSHPFVRQIGQECQAKMKVQRKEPDKDYYLF